jgi:DNA-binding transcriptional regulator YhcF (GntR family)
VKQTIDNSKPIFQQIKEQIEDMIMNDTISETGRVPQQMNLQNITRLILQQLLKVLIS